MKEMELSGIAKKTLAEIVLEDSRAMGVFNALGIDFCCGGQMSLEDACLRLGLPEEEVRQQLFAALLNPPQDEVAARVTDLPNDQLANHIVEKHHRYVRTMAPELTRLLEKIAQVHGGAHPELHDLKAVFAAVMAELNLHMHKEEMILFPYIRGLALASRGEATYTSPPFGTVANPIRMMEMEHESAGGGFRKIHELTCDFALPEGACATYWQAFHYLKEFENDLHEHIHLENNLLFPRALQMENSLQNQMRYE